MKDGLFLRYDREGVMWIYLWFEGQESLLGYLTRNNMKDRDRLERYVAKQKEVQPT